MATSALIKIKTKDGIFSAKLYKHNNGEPERTLSWLKKFQEEFSTSDDPEYKLAQLIRSSVTYQSIFNLDPSNLTGWGVIVDNKMCVDYEYTLLDDKTIDITENI